MRRLQGFILVLVLVISTVPTSVLAQDSTDEPNNTSIYLPFLLENPQQEQPQQGPFELTPTDSAWQPGLVENAEKDSISASSRGLRQDSLQLASIIVVFDESVNPDDLAAIGEGQVIHRYRHVFNGASFVLPEQNIERLADLQGVEAVYLDRIEQLTTDVSPEFIGATNAWQALGGQQSASEGVIVGILDSGIWPEHPSLSDPDPFGNTYPAPPVIPGSNGDRSGKSTCDFGNQAYNIDDAPFSCNNKLIGAYSFLDTYKAVIGLLPNEFDSARDDNGHGTHTATTAAGNGNVAASIFGIPRGIISGIAPRAHVLAFRVCGDQGCFQSDSAAAVERAILDGVDVINFSIGGGNAPYSDPVSFAFLLAYDAGVVVTPSAGNSGPGADTVSHLEPWALTVGANTSDRHFLTDLMLTASNGDSISLVGASVTLGIDTPTPVVFAPDPDCNAMAMPAGTFSGEIVVCQRTDPPVIPRWDQSFNVAAAGGGGMILHNLGNQGLYTDNHFVPAVNLDTPEGDQLLDFLATHTGVMATFDVSTARSVQGDVMADFSSRGGPGQTLGISKPDVTAPGRQILAGTTPLPAASSGGAPGELFQSIQGTSMSAPHAAGAAALVKAAHPDWTPGQVKSALMLTALTDGVTKEDGVTPGDPFDYGSGRIRPDVAIEAGFTIDESAVDYLVLENELWNTNYPSLYVPVMPGVIAAERTLHNETDKQAKWKLDVVAPPDLEVTVPKHVSLPPSGDAAIEIEVDAKDVPLGEVRHAWIEFKQGNERLHFPITIVRQQPAVTMDKECTPAGIGRGETTTCTITVQNNLFEPADVHVVDILPRELALNPASVSGGTVTGLNTVEFVGTLVGEDPADINVTVDSAASPFGYFPPGSLGIQPISGIGDETIVNFNVPPFIYAGVTYSQIGIVSNGYVVVGGGTGADIDFINTDFPNPTVPNNVLAPFWTNLNPGAGGAIRFAVLTDGINSWIVVDWEAVPNFSDGLPNTFQIWIGVDGFEDISYAYGPVTGGDLGFLTVGAENVYGNRGATVYFDGVGTPPADSTTGYEVLVSSAAGAPGEIHTITFEVTGDKHGVYTNYATLFSDSIAGDNVATFQGVVFKNSKTLEATLSGAAEVPAGSGDPDGTGSVEIRIDATQGTLCFDLSVSNIDGDVVAAHLHEGEADENGPVVVDFDYPNNGLNGCVVGLSGHLLKDIYLEADEYYVNVHSSVYPAGAVRGQLEE